MSLIFIYFSKKGGGGGGYWRGAISGHGRNTVYSSDDLLCTDLIYAFIYFIYKIKWKYCCFIMNARPGTKIN